MVVSSRTEDSIMTTAEEINRELERLRAENEALKEIIHLRNENQSLHKEAAQGSSLKVSDKGAVSVYGLGRFPVTLYKEQWYRLLAISDQIKDFIRENEDKLKTRS
jgi:hypothetical protein